MFDYQKQILIGTILGGSSLVKPPKGVNYYLSMRSQNSMWLEYKMAELEDYFTNPTLRKYGNTFRCNSSCHEGLTEVRNMLYDDDGRKIRMEILDQLMDIGIAIWYLDSGSKTGRNKKNAYINTTKFGVEGTEIVRQYFCEVGMECRVNHDGDRLKVLFTVEGTLNLLKITAHKFPTFMFYRV